MANNCSTLEIEAYCLKISGVNGECGVNNNEIKGYNKIYGNGEK